MSERVDRLRPRPDKSLVAKLTKLISAVTRLIAAGESCDAEIEEINALSGGTYTELDFTDLASWTSPREAATLAACGGPVALDGLSRDDLVEMVEAITSAKEPTATHFLRLLEIGFPQSGLCDLIFYPFRRELSGVEIVNEMLLRHTIWKDEGLGAVRARLYELAGQVLADPQAARWSREWADGIVSGDGMA